MRAHEDTGKRATQVRIHFSVGFRDHSTFFEVWRVFISFRCSRHFDINAHLDHTLFIEVLASEASLLAKSPPPRISTESTTVAVVGDDTYRSIWGVCLCVRVCLRSRFRRGYMSWCTCVLAEMLPPLHSTPTPQHTHTDANTNIRRYTMATCTVSCLSCRLNTRVVEHILTTNVSLVTAACGISFSCESRSNEIPRV